MGMIFACIFFWNAICSNVEPVLLTAEQPAERNNSSCSCRDSRLCLSVRRGGLTQDFQDYFYPIKVAIQSEHREVAHSIRAIDQLFEQGAHSEAGNEKTKLLNEHLTSLRERLERHFHQEEMEGYLDEAVATLPRLSSEANQIKNQLLALLGELDELLENSRGMHPTEEAWNQMAKEYRVFAEHVLQHEAAEIRVLQKGYNEELDLEP